MSITRWAQIPIILAVALFLGTDCFPATAFAQGGGLSPATVADYGLKLTQAQKLQADIASQVACLNTRDRALETDRDVNQERLGDLRAQERKLSSDVATQQAAYQGYQNQLRTEENKLGGLQRELGELSARKYLQEEAVRQCKDGWSPNFLCDAANTLAHFFGEFVDVENAIATSERRVSSARGGVRDLEQRLDQSRRDLAATEAQITATSDSIRRTEQDIQILQTALAALRVDVQGRRRLFEDFQGALNEAKTVDTADGRARTARRVGDIAANIDLVIAQSADVMARANSNLPADWKKACAA